MKKFVSMISVVLLLLSVISSCTNNYKPEYETDTETHEKSDTENEPKKTVDELAKIYGEPHDLNGATEYYIKEASVFTTKIVPDGYTFINFGYASGIDAMQQMVVSSHWIGFDSSAHQFSPPPTERF